MNKHVETLLNKEMTRKEFLGTLGFGLASILGFSSIIHFLTGKSAGEHAGHTVAKGYGTSVYGGHREG